MGHAKSEALAPHTGEGDRGETRTGTGAGAAGRLLEALHLGWSLKEVGFGLLRRDGGLGETINMLLLHFENQSLTPKSFLYP